MADARLSVYNVLDESSYSLNQPLSKYNKTTSIGLYCRYPIKSIIRSTCGDILDIVQECAKIDNLDDFISTVKDQLEIKNPNYDNDIILCEIGTRVKQNLSNSMIDLYVLIPPIDNKICAFCGEEAQLKCAMCRVSYYCDKECQKNDWQTSHKEICKLCNQQCIMLKMSSF